MLVPSDVLSVEDGAVVVGVVAGVDVSSVGVDAGAAGAQLVASVPCIEDGAVSSAKATGAMTVAESVVSRVAIAKVDFFMIPFLV